MQKGGHDLIGYTVLAAFAVFTCFALANQFGDAANYLSTVATSVQVTSVP